jgi:hypothetical protein
MSQITMGRAADQASDAALEVYEIELVAGTPVLTLDGALPVEHLLPGDRVITRSGAVRLSGISSQVVPDAALLRISASALGHDRPEDDVLLPPDQPILLRDWRAKALFGADRASVPAARLIDGSYVRAEHAPSARLVHLRFAQPVVIYAAGLELSCRTARVPA